MKRLIGLLCCVSLIALADIPKELTHAIAKKDEGRIKELLAAHPDWLNETNSQGQTAIFQATAYSSPAIVQILVDHGASVEQHDALGLTPLHYVAGRHDTPEMLDYLVVQRKADVMARGNYGTAPLHCAAQVSAANVKLLLEHGADPNARDTLGRYPRDLAKAYGRDDCLPLLKVTAAPPEVLDPIRPGDFYLEEPTLHSLGFRWYIEGDASRQGTGKVKYREAGKGEWLRGPDPLRIGGEKTGQEMDWIVPNAFVGSILHLTPGTRYQLKATLGDIMREVEMTTRPVPAAMPEARVITITPETEGGIQAAYDQAEPGDILLLQPGHYQQDLIFNKQATAEKPIVIRGAGAVTLQGQGNVLIDASGSAHHIIENVTLDDADILVKGDGATALTVRHCVMTRMTRGVSALNPTSRGFVVTDNEMTGPIRVERWQTGEREVGKSQGVWISGQGHSIGGNRIHGFWDGLSIFGRKPPTDRDRQNAAIDFYDNNISFTVDDGIEMDYGMHNIRVWGNRIYNVFMGISSQPLNGGPGYVLHNVVYNCTRAPLKPNVNPAGLIVVNNTFVTHGGAMDFSADWQNSRLINNLFVGGIESRTIIETGTTTPSTSWVDYNGYAGTSADRWPFIWKSPIPQIVNTGRGLNTRLSYATFADYQAGHPFHYDQHSHLVDTSVFVRYSEPTGYAAAEWPISLDLRLAPGSEAVGTGLAVPGLTTDNPNLGALPCAPKGD